MADYLHNGRLLAETQFYFTNVFIVYKYNEYTQLRHGIYKMYFCQLLIMVWRRFNFIFIFNKLPEATKLNLTRAPKINPIENCFCPGVNKVLRSGRAGLVNNAQVTAKTRYM